MFEIKKLLVPVDFSPRSEAAAKHAAAIAGHFGAEILFLYAVPHGPYEHGLFDAGFNAGAVWPAAEEIESAVAQQLTAFMDRTAPNAKRFAQVASGGAAEKIREAAEQEQVDLIIMPTHGYGPFRRFILGSVTQVLLTFRFGGLGASRRSRRAKCGRIGWWPAPWTRLRIAKSYLAGRGFQSQGAKLRVHAALTMEGLLLEASTCPRTCRDGRASARRAEELMSRLGVQGEGTSPAMRFRLCAGHRRGTCGSVGDRQEFRTAGHWLAAPTR
jgi:nucleotide-binding universal stress UspA family protein